MSPLVAIGAAIVMRAAYEEKNRHGHQSSGLIPHEDECDACAEAISHAEKRGKQWLLVQIAHEAALSITKPALERVLRESMIYGTARVAP